MGAPFDFFSADSTSTAEDSRIAVTDQGSAVRGTNSRILHSGAVDLTGARVQAAPNITGNKDTSITINEGGGGSGSNDQLVGLLGTLIANQSNAASSPATNLIGPTQDSGPTIDATGSDSLLGPPATNPTTPTGPSIWIVLAAVGAVLFFLLKK